MVGFALFLAQGASAQSVSKGCDIEFYNQLKGAAKLKGSREMEAAQAIILKPDSVLHYSCFLQQANSLRQELPFKKSMKGMSEAVIKPFDKYLDNYAHNMDGGLIAPPPNAGGPCNVMGMIWHTAKCNDFDPALFAPFNEAGADMRTFPQSCGGRRADIAGLQLDAKVPAGGPGAGDAMPSYHGDLTVCGAPVPTGLKVTIDGQEHDDVVCLAPGCYYDGATCRASP